MSAILVAIVRRAISRDQPQVGYTEYILVVRHYQWFGIIAEANPFRVHATGNEGGMIWIAGKCWIQKSISASMD